jgi:hypothetical protein
MKADGDALSELDELISELGLPASGPLPEASV